MVIKKYVNFLMMNWRGGYFLRRHSLLSSCSSKEFLRNFPAEDGLNKHQFYLGRAFLKVKGFEPKRVRFYPTLSIWNWLTATNCFTKLFHRYYSFELAKPVLSTYFQVTPRGPSNYKCGHRLIMQVSEILSIA